MDIPRDRLLVMVIAATGFAVLVAGWSGGLLRAEAEGRSGAVALVAVVVALVLVLVGMWLAFRRIDRSRT